MVKRSLATGTPLQTPLGAHITPVALLPGLRGRDDKGKEVSDGKGNGGENW